MGNPAAAPIPFQTVLTDQKAVFLGFGEACGRPLVVYPRYKSNFGTASLFLGAPRSYDSEGIRSSSIWRACRAIM